MACQFNLRNLLVLSLGILIPILIAVHIINKPLDPDALLKIPFHKAFNTIYQPNLDAGLRQRSQGYAVMFFLAEQHANRTHKPIVILETGSIRSKELNIAGDGASTFIFNHFVKEKNGQVYSVDLDGGAKAIIDKDLKLSHVKAYTNDSVVFLRDFPQPQDVVILYLDSYDVDFSLPAPAALHHLKEIETIFARLKPGTIIAVDDNLIINGRRTGKGYMVEEFLKQRGVPLVYDGYQKVFQIQPQQRDLDILKVKILKAPQ